MSGIPISKLSSAFYGAAKPPIFSSRMKGRERRIWAQVVADILGPLESSPNFRQPGSPYQLNPAEITALKEQLDVLPKGTTWEVLGARLIPIEEDPNPNKFDFHPGGVLFQIPDSIAGDAEMSVCGRKGALVEKLIRWQLPGKNPEEAIGMDFAIMEIGDSPTHKHGLTDEKYIPRKPTIPDFLGKPWNQKDPLGVMYLEQDDICEIHTLAPGEALDLNHGIIHGWLGLAGPVDIILDFKPALVKKPTAPGISLEEIALRQKYRDEKIVYGSTFDRIKTVIK